MSAFTSALFKSSSASATLEDCSLFIVCPIPSRMVHISELRPPSVYRKFGAGREGRVERKEEDGLGDFLRRPPALHGNHAGHLLPKLGGRVLIGEHLAQDRRVDGAGRHRVDSNLARKQLGGERPSE